MLSKATRVSPSALLESEFFDSGVMHCPLLLNHTKHLPCAWPRVPLYPNPPRPTATGQPSELARHRHAACGALVFALPVPVFHPALWAFHLFWTFACSPRLNMLVLPSRTLEAEPPSKCKQGPSPDSRLYLPWPRCS